MLKETHNQVVWGRNPRHAAPQADKLRRTPTRHGNRLLPGRVRPTRSLAIAPGGGCRSQRRLRGGAESNRLRAIHRNANSSRFSPRLGKRDPPAEPYSSVSRRRGGVGSGDASWRNPGRCTPMREGFGGAGRRVWYPDRRTIFDTAMPSPPSGDRAWRFRAASGHAAPA